MTSKEYWTSRREEWRRKLAALPARHARGDCRQIVIETEINICSYMLKEREHV